MENKIVAIERQAEAALNALSTVPMNADRKVHWLKRALHEILKTARSEYDAQSR